MDALRRIPKKEPDEEQPVGPPTEPTNKFTMPGWGLVLVLVVLIGGYLLYQPPRQETLSIEDEARALVEKVAGLILLPADETPTIATVIDPEKLRDQPFFAKAEKGDKVLIYTRSQKAVLYDPDDNKIKEVAPLVIGESEQ